MFLKKKKKISKLDRSPKARTFKEKPRTVFEAVNMFGTYNIQKTADTENEFPKIAQGLPKDEQ